jgi:GH24 family phage-related lysozyme (muramidase)
MTRFTPYAKTSLAGKLEAHGIRNPSLRWWRDNTREYHRHGLWRRRESEVSRASNMYVFCVQL